MLFLFSMFNSCNTACGSLVLTSINQLFKVQSHHRNGLRALLGKDINTLIKPSTWSHHPKSHKSKLGKTIHNDRNVMFHNVNTPDCFTSHVHIAEFCVFWCYFPCYFAVFVSPDSTLLWSTEDND